MQREELNINKYFSGYTDMTLPLQKYCSKHKHKYFAFHVNVKTIHAQIKKIHKCPSDAHTNIPCFKYP